MSLPPPSTDKVYILTLAVRLRGLMRIACSHCRIAGNVKKWHGKTYQEISGRFGKCLITWNILIFLVDGKWSMVLVDVNHYLIILVDGKSLIGTGENLWRRLITNKSKRKITMSWCRAHNKKLYPIQTLLNVFHVYSYHIHINENNIYI